MYFLAVLVATVVLVWVLRKPLKSWPVAFYCAAIGLNALYVAGLFATLPPALSHLSFLLLQKCTLALALFMVVMFVGVFDKSSRVALGLRPIRAELSITACLLAIGHMAAYLIAFAPRLAQGADLGLALFATTAISLLFLLALLGITSAARVKRSMKAALWKRIQKLAYVFFGLIYVHLLSILLPSALAGGQVAQVSIGIYTVLMAFYLFLRLRRARADRESVE